MPTAPANAMAVWQAAKLGLRIVDQLFVHEAVHLPRLDPVHMIHQPDIVAVIAADVGEIVTIALAARELFAKIGQTAVKRVAAHVDDAGIGQDQPDQAGEQPIVWHLVEEMGAPEPPVDPGAVEIVGAEVRDEIEGQGGDGGKVALVDEALGPAKPARNGSEVGQFHCAFDRRMTGQHLLDQG